jgi:DNA processing protein
VYPRIVHLGDADYPPRLRDLADPPERLHIAGELPRGFAVAIVGTRHPTTKGETFAHDLARKIARAGVAVLSGGALGIDSAAHRGALDGGGVTVVVAPSALDEPFPQANSGLFAEIVDRGGAVVTSCSPGTKARRHLFFDRNRQLAALGHALVVVESRFRGGARNAAAAARRLGRPLLAVPGAPWMKKSGGCLAELRLGASLAASADDVLVAIGAPRALPDRRAGSGAQAELFEQPLSAQDPERRAVLEALAGGALYPDALVVQAGLAPPRLQAMLLTLTLDGIVVSEPSGRVSLTKR